MNKSFEEIAHTLSACEKDLILGRGTWGAWVTATYPELIRKGLMTKETGGSALVVKLSTLGQEVADYLSTRHRYFDEESKGPQVSHELKSWSHFYDAIVEGSKKHDLRDDTDRNFKVGEYLRLRRYDPFLGEYTGESTIVRVTYITGRATPCAFSSAVLDRNFVILSLEIINENQ